MKAQFDSFPSPRITITKSSGSSSNVFGDPLKELNNNEDVFNLFRKPQESHHATASLNKHSLVATNALGHVVELEVPTTFSRSSSLSSLIDDSDSEDVLSNSKQPMKQSSNNLLGEHYPYNNMKASSESICLHNTVEDDISPQIKESKPHDRILKELLLNEFGMAESSAWTTTSTTVTSSSTQNMNQCCKSSPFGVSNTHDVTTTVHPTATTQTKHDHISKNLKTTCAATKVSSVSHQKNNSTTVRPKVNSNNGAKMPTTRHDSTSLKKTSPPTKPENPKNSKVDPLILNLEKAMNTLYVKPQTHPTQTVTSSTMIVVTPEAMGDSPSPFAEQPSTPTKSSPLSLLNNGDSSQPHTLKKPSLSIKIESPSHVNTKSKNKLVKYEGTRIYQGKNQPSNHTNMNCVSNGGTPQFTIPPSSQKSQQQQKTLKAQTITSNNCTPSSTVTITTNNNEGEQHPPQNSKSLQPSSTTSHSGNNHQKLCIWERIKQGSNAIQKRIDTMKTSLQRGGSQLSLTTMLAPTLSATNGSSKLNLLSDLKRMGSKRELSTPKPKIPNDIFNPSSILFKIHDLIQNRLLRERENKITDKVKWRLKKKFKRLIAQQQAEKEKKDRQLHGIYEHRKRLTRFQMQAVLNTVDPLRLIPQQTDDQEGHYQKQHSATSNHSLKSNNGGTSSNENSARNSINSYSNVSSNNTVDYHEKNREEIMKQQKILEQLESELFQQDHNSRKVKFGDEKSTSSTNNSSTLSSMNEKSVDSQKLMNTNHHQEQHLDHTSTSIAIRNRTSSYHPSSSQRPHSAPLRGGIAVNHEKKNAHALQDLMIEKEVSKRKMNASMSSSTKVSTSKNSTALSKTFSETKLKLFNPYAPKVPLRDGYHDSNATMSAQDDKTKNKGNTLVIEFQKMVLQENELKQGGLNHSSVTEVEEGPTTDLYDFSSVNPFDAVKNMNIASKTQHVPAAEILARTSADTDKKKASAAQQTRRKRLKIKPPLDTGLKVKEKREAVLTMGIVCDIGKFTL
ncbi:hypothetical protein C9374_011562 [Naegleria lovaniensis]|uniref:Uncharacterized protein n=1 Tax=Naegleria lovaniensis TaxID=51637 RepID=A0AA88H4H9_NAELO|nr:uncharacterized protein C9374_011562 [Naegleria lovaniensis]KAG2392837.1 hypothetical protein C9374_011562 [Naegleria lovaniensis]